MRTVEELMSQDLVTLEEEAALPQVDDLLAFNHIRHLPVVRHGRLVGLVTHRDLLRALAREAASPQRPLRVKEIMTRELEVVSPSTPLREVVSLLLDNKFGCLPVVDEAGRLVGLITESDLVRLAGRLLEQEQPRLPTVPAAAGPLP